MSDEIAYPRLIRRVRAVLIDSVLMPVAVFASLTLGDAFGVSSQAGKVILLVGPIFVLEPGLVALTGGTVGHHSQGIRVTRTDGIRNLNIIATIVRFAVKLLLGWLSFIFVFTTSKHQAVHDLVARSLVIHKDATGLPTFEVLAERVFDRLTYDYPSAWRRAVVIIGYVLAATVVLSVASAIVTSADCLNRNRCTTLDGLFEIALNVCWLLGIGWIVVRGWNGLLVGCRRRLRVPTA